MKKIYFVGQDNFGNRGCEALVRSNVKIISQYLSDAEFIVPTAKPELDKKQWPDHAKFNVKFTAAEPFPSRIVWWSRSKRLLPFLSSYKPSFNITPRTMTDIKKSDYVIMTGGDIISFDYGLESLYYWQNICEAAIREGKKVILWAASVGPFSKNKTIEKNMVSFLNKFSLITVREKNSLNYLNDIGVTNVKLVMDPAFTLDFDNSDFYDSDVYKSGNKTLGFNISPLITKFRETPEQKASLTSEVLNFLNVVISEYKFSVLLIPHVGPLDGSKENSDYFYMHQFFNELKAKGYSSKQIDIVPNEFNATQLKSLIKKCDYFMGARTHATVASISQGVPTTSIAYSVKAKGINEALFGNLKYVLETPSISTLELKKHLDILIQDESLLRKYISEHIDTWREGSYLSVKHMLNLNDGL